MEKKYAPVMIGMLVLLMNLADLKNSNLISGSIICQAAERQSENTETENNSGGTEKEKITQTEASTVSDILEELDLSRVQRMLDQMLGEESFSMKDMLDGLIKGEKVLSEDTVQEMVHSFLFSGLEKEKSLLIKYCFLFYYLLYWRILQMFLRADRLEISVFILSICCCLFC